MAETSGIERLLVELDERGYDILIGPDLIARAGAEILPLLRRRQAVIVTDETVARHHLAPLRASLAEHGIAERTVVLPPGASRQLGRRQHRDQHRGGQEPARRLLPAAPRAGGHREPCDTAASRSARRI